MNCYNSEKFLHEAIDSVIAQTYENWEIIFWDNQSKDNSAAIFRSYDDKRCRYFYAPIHCKLYCARNLAIEKSSGEYVTFLDCDDAWHPEKLERQINNLLFSGYKFSCTNFLFIDSESNPIKKAYFFKKKSGFVTASLAKGYYIGILTVMIERSLLLKNAMPFFEEYNHVGDFELFFSLSETEKIHYDTKALANYRRHGDNLSTRREIEQLREWNQVLRKFKKRSFYKVRPEILHRLSLTRRFILLKMIIKRKKRFPLIALMSFLIFSRLDLIKLLVYWLVSKSR